jgi:hypothetical protein
VTAEIDLKPGWRAGLPVGDMIEIFGEVTSAGSDVRSSLRFIPV